MPCIDDDDDDDDNGDDDDDDDNNNNNNTLERWRHRTRISNPPVTLWAMRCQSLRKNGKFREQEPDSWSTIQLRGADPFLTS